MRLLMLLLTTILSSHAEDVSITSKSNSNHLLVKVHWPADTINERYIWEDGSKDEDRSSLYIDMDMDGKDSQNDLCINLNISPEYPGMYKDEYVQISTGAFVWAKTGAIDAPAHIIHDKDGRHDTFLLPLDILKPAKEVKIRYEGESPADKMTVTSSYKKVSLNGSDTIDIDSIIDDRYATFDKQGNKINRVETLQVGDTAPKIHGEKWIGEEPTGIRLVAFWATWCGPCIATIPKLNQLASEGINVVGVIEQNYKHVMQFQKRQQMNYPQATSSQSVNAFGIERKGLPWYFILDSNNKVLWVGEKIVVEDVNSIIKQAQLDGTQ